ncbi:MAG: hypothetical protein AAF715_32080 [Myxococcota bacterium]
MYIESRHDGDGLGGPGLAGVDEAKRGLASALSKEADALAGGRVADVPPAWLFGWRVLVVGIEQAAHTLGGAAGHLSHVLGGGRSQRP